MPFGKKINTALKPIRVSKNYRVETKAIEDEEGMISAIVSTESKDRDGEVILASAWSKKAIGEFMTHPVLISSHNYDDLTKQIGEWVSLKATDNGLEGVCSYYIGKGNKEADWGYELALRGKSAYSIGFIANDYLDGNGKDDATRTYTDIELLEISQVTIPSNRDSLVTMRSKGIDPIADEIATELLNEEQQMKPMNKEIKMPYPEEDMFATQEEAEARAEELGCEGSHEMEDEDGETFFMPCNSHESYEETVKPSEDEDEENEDESPQDDEYDEDKKDNCDCACQNDAKRGHTQATKVAKVYSPTDAVQLGIQEAINELITNK